jgi:hypothetical protein
MTATWTAILWENDFEPVTHVQLGLSRLLAEYQDYTDHPRVHDFLRTFLTQNQNLEDVSWQVFVERWPYTAEGVQLDVLGRLVGQGRGGRLDDLYRLWILARIKVNRSNGQVEELYDILEILGPETMAIQEGWPSELKIAITGADEGEEIGELIAQAKAGGVSLHWQWSAELDGAIFRFDAAGAGVSTDANQGFAEAGAGPFTTGGVLMMEDLS